MQINIYEKLMYKGKRKRKRKKGSISVFVLELQDSNFFTKEMVSLKYNERLASQTGDPRKWKNQKVGLNCFFNFFFFCRSTNHLRSTINQGTHKKTNKGENTWDLCGSAISLRPQTKERTISFFLFTCLGWFRVTSYTHTHTYIYNVLFLKP